MTGFLRPEDVKAQQIELWRQLYSLTDAQHLRFLSYGTPPLSTSAAPNAQIALNQVMEEKNLEPMTAKEYWAYIALKFG